MKNMNSDISWIRWVVETNQASFPANSDIANLIEWYLLCFRTVLTNKFKMAAQNDCQKHCANRKKWYIYFEQDWAKKGNKLWIPTILLSIVPGHGHKWNRSMNLTIVDQHGHLRVASNDSSISRDVTFLVFNLSPAAILGRHLEFEGQDRPKIQ